MSFTPPSTFPDSHPTNGNDGQWGTFTLTYLPSSSTSTEFYYGFDFGSGAASGHELYYSTTTGEWHDPSTNAEPHSLTSTNSSTRASNSGTVQNGDTIYCWNAQPGATSGVIMYEFTMAGLTSGGGSGGNQPLSNTPPIIQNVAFAKNGADDELTLTFDWDENGGDFSSFHIYKEKASDGSIVSVSHGVTGSSGNVSINSSDKAILGNLSSGDKLWIRNNPSYTNNVPDWPLDIVDGFGGIGSPYTHLFIDWSIDFVNGVRSVIAKYYGENTGFTYDHHLLSLGPTNQLGPEHSHTGSLITKSLPYITGSNEYRVQKALSDDGFGVTGWGQYGNDFRTRRRSRGRNFW